MSGLDLVFKYIVVIAGNGIDVMLTHDHDRQFISISTSPSVAGQFSHARAKPLHAYAGTHSQNIRFRWIAVKNRCDRAPDIHIRSVQSNPLPRSKVQNSALQKWWRSVNFQDNQQNSCHQTSYNYRLKCIGVPRIWQWRGSRSGAPDQGVWGLEVPQWGPVASPRGRESGGRNPPETEAKCEISVQFLTFSCIKFWI